MPGPVIGDPAIGHRERISLLMTERDLREAISVSGAVKRPQRSFGGHLRLERFQLVSVYLKPRKSGLSSTPSSHEV